MRISDEGEWQPATGWQTFWMLFGVTLGCLAWLFLVCLLTLILIGAIK